MTSSTGRREMKLIIAFGMPVVIAVVFNGINKYLRTQHRTHYHPLSKQELFAGVYAIRDDYVNVWFIWIGFGLVAVDTPMNAYSSRREAARLNLRPRR
jgi:hypothetical protein